MNVEGRIFKNAFRLSVAKALGDLCSFLFLAYFGRSFGSHALGQYAFAMAVGGLLTIFASLGLNTYIVRDLSREPKKTGKYLGSLLMVRGGLSVFSWGLILLFSEISQFNRETQALLVLIGGYHVFYRLTGLLRAGFIAHEEMQYPAFLEVSHKALILLVGSALIAMSDDPVISLGVYPVSGAAMFVLAFIISRSKYGRFDFGFDYEFTRKSIQTARTFFVILLLGQFYDRIGVIVLTYLKGEASAGFYLAGNRFIVTLSAGLALFSTAIFPALAKLSDRSREKLYDLCRWALRLMALGLFPLSMVIFFLSDQIVDRVFGPRFFGSGRVLQVLAWSLLFMGFNSVLSSLLVVLNHQRKLVKIRLLVYAGYFGGILLFIPPYDFVGLAWCKVAGDGVLFLVTLVCVYQITHETQILRMFIVPFLSCASILALFSSVNNFGIWTVVILILAIYGGALFLFRTIRLKDFLFLKTLFIGGGSG